MTDQSQQKRPIRGAVFSTAKVLGILMMLLIFPLIFWPPQDDSLIGIVNFFLPMIIGLVLGIGLIWMMLPSSQHSSFWDSSWVGPNLPILVWAQLLLGIPLLLVLASIWMDLDFWDQGFRAGSLGRRMLVIYVIDFFMLLTYVIFFFCLGQSTHRPQSQNNPSTIS